MTKMGMIELRVHNCLVFLFSFFFFSTIPLFQAIAGLLGHNLGVSIILMVVDKGWIWSAGWPGYLMVVDE